MRPETLQSLPGYSHYADFPVKGSRVADRPKDCLPGCNRLSGERADASPGSDGALPALLAVTATTGFTPGDDQHFGAGTLEDAHLCRGVCLGKDAEQGDVGAQLNLGESYEWGSTGLPRDKTAALYWCQKAAQQKSPIKNLAEQCVARVK